MNKKLPFLYDGNEITASKMGREFQMILNNELKNIFITLITYFFSITYLF